MSRTTDLYDQYILNTAKRSFTLVRGKGVRVWDDAGRELIDFGTGVAVNSLGHAHPALVETFATQPAKLIHCSNLYYNENAGPVAEKLVKQVGPGKIFFANSGAEANEGLIKLARLHGHKHRNGAYEIVSTKNSFHGRTMATITATGQEKIYAGFEPLLPGSVHVPFNDIEAMKAAIGPKTAAVLIEGIQGEGGIIPADAAYLKELRQLTREAGVLLLLDAVQCGFFRTGRFQSYQRLLEDDPAGADFLPDAISMAKSLGGGFPIGAFWVSDAHAGLFAVGSHNTTYGGSPLGTAVIGTILDTIEKDGLARNVREREADLLGGLRALQAQYPSVVKDVRGLGAMIGLELAAEPAATVPKFHEAGLLLAPAGRNTLRYLPPYIVTKAEIGEALERTETALKALRG